MSRVASIWHHHYNSIRWRLTLWYVGMLTVALLVFGGVVYTWQASALQHQIDGDLAVLRQQAGGMAAGFGGTVHTADGQVEVVGPPPGMPMEAGNRGLSITTANIPCGPTCPPEQGHTEAAVGGIVSFAAPADRDGTGMKLPLPPSADVAVVFGDDGQILAQSGPLTSVALQPVIARAEPAGEPAAAPQDVAFTMAPMEGTPSSGMTEYQFYARRVRGVDGAVTTILLGRPNPALEQLRRLTSTLLVAAVLTLFLVGAGGYWLASRALRPVRVMSRVAKEISETDLSRRLNLPNQDELGELASTFDAMLDRLEAAFRRQRQFTDDASHELRTPLAIVQLEIDRALAHDTLPSASAQALATIRAETMLMSRLVGDLLTLARADDGKALTGLTPLDLSDVTLEVIERLGPLARDAGIEVQVGDLPELPVLGHRLLLAQMLSNLIHNACTHTAGHGRCVAVSASRELVDGRPWSQIAIRDSGPGIPAEHLPHLFRRFYRVDQSRTELVGPWHGVDMSGSGLGLAIVQWVASAHGGSAHVESDVGQGSVFVVRLPLTATPVALPGL